MAQGTKHEAVTTPEVVRADDAGSFTNSETQSSSTRVNNITLYSVYDNFNCLTEIRLDKLKTVPRVVLQIMRYLVPNYKNVTRFTTTNCKIDASIIYEISNIVSASTITQVCLDGSPLKEGNYGILLDTSALRYLSLSRCNINDDVCEILASKLHMSSIGEKLSLLNLSFNNITDVGAKSLAEALRTNRFLRYLNIADNEISDDGAISILRVLMAFPLTLNETLNKKQRYYTYLRKKQSLCLKYYMERRSSGDVTKALKRKKTSATSFKSKSSARKEKENQPSTLNDDLRAKQLAEQILGPFVDPFQADCIECLDGEMYCLGNLALSLLNISYNNLSFITIKALKDVVSYQKGVRKVRTHNGLIKVVIDGNNLPVQCPEMIYINDLLDRKNMEFTRHSRAFTKV